MRIRDTEGIEDRGDGSNPWRPVDLLVAALAVRFTDGYVASAKLVKDELRASRDEAGAGGQDVRWPGFARRLAFDMFDMEALRVLIGRSVEFAHERGALGVLPKALDFMALLRTFEGDLDAAEALLQEEEAIAGATRTDPVGAARLTLAGFRGIIPCGITDAGVTTVSEVVSRDIGPADILDSIVSAFQAEYAGVLA